MIKSKKKLLRRCLTALSLGCILTFSMGTSVFAYSDPETPVEESVPETKEETEKNPFTPEGNGSILNEATSDQNKYFYTIQTANNNTFYMVIDKERESGNVYLLSMIDENDLQDFIEEEETSEPDSGGLPETEFLPDKEKPTETPTVTPTPETPETSEKTPASKTSTGKLPGMIAICLLAAGIFAGYYFLKIRHKDTEDEEDETLGTEDEAEEPDDEAEAAEAEESDEPDDAYSETADYPDPADYPDSESNQ